MENKPIETIEFDVVLTASPEVTKLVSSKKTVINLYTNYLTYLANYTIEEEYKFSKNDSDTEDSELKRLRGEEVIETKKLKIEDEGLIPAKGLYISRITENVLNKPEEGTTLYYRILLEYLDNVINFNFTDKKLQKEVYNKLINWQINQNKWS